MINVNTNVFDHFFYVKRAFDKGYSVSPSVYLSVCHTNRSRVIEIRFTPTID